MQKEQDRMAKLNLGRTVETISWSDEPGAKSYTIDMSDRGLYEMWQKTKPLYMRLRGMDMSGKHDPEETAKAIHDFVSAVLGEDAYKDALAYVDVRNEGAAACNVMMMGLVAGLAEIVLRGVGNLKKSKLKKYTDAGAADAEADLI